MLLNAQQILAVRDRTTRTVSVPEWGTDAEVLIGSMGALDMAALQDWVEHLGSQTKESDDIESCDSKSERHYSMKENIDVMVRWCALSILDPETHERTFTDADIQALGTKSLAALQRIYEAALQLDLATRESRQAFEKNSGRTTGDSSGSD